MGPINGLIKLFAKEAGRKMGGVVKRDIEMANKLSWTQADKIKELSTDNGLSPSYLEKIIENSKNHEQLQSVRSYLVDSKRSYNLSFEFKKKMITSIKEKMEYIEDNETLKQFIKLIKEKGLDHLL